MLHRLEWPGGGIEFHPSHGDWIRVLGANGLVVEALHELDAPSGAPTHEYHDIATAQWPAGGRWKTSGRPAPTVGTCDPDRARVGVSRLRPVRMMSFTWLGNFLFIPQNPFWTLSVIARDVLVIWALTVHGAELQQ